MINLHKNAERLMSEINIIPFTDILLVILITFMVMTPLLIQSVIKVNLPKAQLHSPVTRGQKITITVAKNNDIFINDKLVAGIEKLSETIKNLNPQYNTVVVNADKDIPYHPGSVLFYLPLI